VPLVSAGFGDMAASEVEGPRVSCSSSASPRGRSRAHSKDCHARVGADLARAVGQAVLAVLKRFYDAADHDPPRVVVWRCGFFTDKNSKKMLMSMLAAARAVVGAFYGVADVEPWTALLLADLDAGAVRCTVDVVDGGAAGRETVLMSMPMSPASTLAQAPPTLRSHGVDLGDEHNASHDAGAVRCTVDVVDGGAAGREAVLMSMPVSPASTPAPAPPTLRSHGVDPGDEHNASIDVGAVRCTVDVVDTLDGALPRAARGLPRGRRLPPHGGLLPPGPARRAPARARGDA